MGIVVVFARTRGDSHRGSVLVAAKARSFNSVSLDPPLLLWTLEKSSADFDDFRRAPSFTIHVLAHDQEVLLQHADTSRVPDTTGAGWTAHPALDLPIHGDCSAWFACDNVSYFDAQDHGIFVAEVKDCAFSDRSPMVSCAGEFVVISDSTALD